jgi:hypothetical protein
MPQPDEDLIELNHFVRSKEWQTILGILDEAERDWLAILIDRDNNIETIRFAQGAIEAIRSFREIPNIVFKGEEKENGSKS